jgi:hypothetical protein
MGGDRAVASDRLTSESAGRDTTRKLEAISGRILPGRNGVTSRPRSVDRQRVAESISACADLLMPPGAVTRWAILRSYRGSRGYS